MVVIEDGRIVEGADYVEVGAEVDRTFKVLGFPLNGQTYQKQVLVRVEDGRDRGLMLTHSMQSFLMRYKRAEKAN